VATANEELYDETIRHAVQVQRFSLGEIKRLLPILEKSERQVAARLADRLSGVAGRGRGEYSTARLASILDQVRDIRQKAIARLKDQLTETLVEKSKEEAEAEAVRIQGAVPVELSLVSVPAETLRGVVTRSPFGGDILRNWFRKLEAADRNRMREAIQQGLVQGETVEQITRRVRDSVFAGSRRDATAVVRTAINHTSNIARDELWKANADLITGLRWTATLDGRTTAICRSRDGRIFPVDSGPRPPAHFNCRSVMVAVVDGAEAVGSRPFVRDDRTGEKRQKDFRKEARSQLRSELGRGATSDEIRTRANRLRKSFYKDNVGQVPAATTYQEWLKRQPAKFQDEILGRTKGALFRRGGLTLDRFVDRQGAELNLKELYARDPKAFRKAGVDAP
jgi:SPP1 gp7 family putative phage head morphogenesis protein